MSNHPQFTVLFPAFSGALREPDPEFHREQRVLEELNIPFHVVNIEALIQGNFEKALWAIHPSGPSKVIYRGCILHPAEYSELDRGLRKVGLHLFISPSEYEAALLFPRWYPLVQEHAIPATWIFGSDPREALRAAQVLSPPPYFIKDFSKSAKEIVPRGCIVKGADIEHKMATSIRQLLDYRASRFEGGIVIRPLVKLRYLADNPFGGELFEEYRLFFFEGELIASTGYDRIVGNVKTLEDFSFLAMKIDSRFFTADIVVTADGAQRILEIGDGGSSALPPLLDVAAFYLKIIEKVSRCTGC